MLQRTLGRISKRVCLSVPNLNTTQATCRLIHYAVQRDTNKEVPHNDIFIRGPDTAPILPCLSYTELQGKFREMRQQELVEVTFVLNAGYGEATKKLRKERSVATLSTPIRDCTVLAICSADVHGEAYGAGATLCLDPEEIGKLSSGEVNVDLYEQVVATTRVMKDIRPLGRILRNKMPHERKGTVSVSIGSAVRRSLVNTEWEMTDSPNHPDYYTVTLPLLKSDFPIVTITDHISIMFMEILNYCPAKTPKDKYIERVEMQCGAQILHLDIREHNAKYRSVSTVQDTVLKKKYSREETWALRESAKDKALFLEEEKDKIGQFLDQRWEDILKSDVSSSVA